MSHSAFAHPIGVHSHLFRGSPAAVVEACRRHGLTCVQLTPSFPGLLFQEPAQITPERCRQAVEPLQSAGIGIAALSGHSNLMDPNLERRHRGLVRLHALIRHCRDFGTERVVCESGSLNPKSPWLPHGPNRSPEAWAELRLIVAAALAVAAEQGVTLLLKPEPTQALASVEDAVRLRAELDHPNLGFVMDPVHFLLAASVHEPAPLARMVEQLGRWTPIVHVKDLRMDEEKLSIPRVGRGSLDYALFLRLLDRHQPQAPLILEHLQPTEAAEARAYLERAMSAAPA